MQKTFTAIAVAVAAVMTLAACQSTEQRKTMSLMASSKENAGEPVIYTGSTVEFWRDAYAGQFGKSVDLEGRLFLPDGDGPFPVVVWQHGSGRAFHKNYVEFRAALRSGLAAHGIGMFIADSFTGRNIKGTGDKQSRLPMASRIIDNLRILEALEKHPRVDSKRIGASGRSAGGTVTIRGSHKPWADAALKTGTRYAAGVAYYPYCGSDFEQYIPVGYPILMLLGEADDYTPHDQCLKQADTMRKGGGNVETITYPRAHHGFISSKPVYWNKHVMVFHKCPIGIQRLDGEFELPGHFVSKGMNYKDMHAAWRKVGCLGRGAHIGRNEAAAQDSLERMIAFFAQHLKQQLES